jgi:hypothetical protein
MADQKMDREFRKGEQANTWVLFLLGILAVVSIVLSACSIISPNPFFMVSGDEQLVKKLLRSDKEGSYRARYEGRNRLWS